MSELRADTITSATDNTDLEIQARGTGVPNLKSGFKVNGIVGVPVSALQTGTDGELITWDASGNPATVATGTAAQVLTSNGAGAAPTFQDIAGSPVVILGSATASASSSLTITGLTGYDTYRIEIEGLRPTTDSVNAYLRLGDSGGIDSAASDYAYSATGNYANDTSWAAEGSSSDAAAQILLTNHFTGEPLGNGTNEGFNASLTLKANSNVAAMVYGVICYTDRYATGPSGGQEVQVGTLGATRTAAITVDRIQLLMSSGTIASGKVTVYGVATA